MDHNTAYKYGLRPSYDFNRFFRWVFPLLEISGELLSEINEEAFLDFAEKYCKEHLEKIHKFREELKTKEGGVK